MQMHKTRASDWGAEAASRYRIWENTKRCRSLVHDQSQACKAEIATLDIVLVRAHLTYLSFLLLVRRGASVY